MLRSFGYKGTDVFLVCFSVMSPSSYENIKEKWIPEILHYCPNTAFLIVGTQIDLREDPDKIKKLTANFKKPITFQQGEKLARETGAWKYLECSALSQVRCLFSWFTILKKSFIDCYYFLERTEECFR